MAVKAQDVYQGNDWLTYNWSVAQLFDTLDHVLDVCRHVPVGISATPQVLIRGTTRDRNETETIDIFACIVELCDNLIGELDAVLADLVSYRPNLMPQRWIGFEMQLCQHAIRQRALHEHRLSQPTSTAITAITAWTMRLRDLLRQLDQ